MDEYGGAGGTGGGIWRGVPDATLRNNNAPRYHRCRAGASAGATVGADRHGNRPLEGRRELTSLIQNEDVEAANPQGSLPARAFVIARGFISP